VVRVSAVWRSEPRKGHNGRMRRIHNHGKNGCPNPDREARCNVSLGAGLFCSGGEHCAAQAYETEYAGGYRTDVPFENDRKQTCAALAPSKAIVCRRDLGHATGRVANRAAAGDVTVGASRVRTRNSHVPRNTSYNAHENAGYAGD